MKPDGVAMATMEPTEALGAEPSQPLTSVLVMEEEEVPQEGSPPTQPEEQARGATAPPAAKEGNGKAAETKDKPKGITKARPGTGGTAGAKTTSQTRPSTRPGTAQSRVMNGVKPSTNDLTKKTAPDKKRTTTTTSTGASSATAAKKPVGGATAAASSVRTQTKVTDRKHVGVPRTNSAATAATNGTKTTTGNGTLSKRPTTGPVNGTRPKTTAPRPTSAPKPSTSVAKPDRTTVPKATRPATQPPTSRPGVSTATSRPPGTSTTARPPAHRLGATAPPAGRTTVAQSSKPTTAKKDVTRPPAKKPVASATTKLDAPKPTTAPRSDTVSKHPTPSKTADLKTARPQATRKAPPTARPPATRQPLGRTPPASPITKPAAGSTAQAIKRTSKPTQSVVPFSITKKPHGATATVAATAAVVAVVSATSTEPEVAAQAEAEEVSPDVPSAPVPALITVSPPSPSPVEVTPPGYHDTPAEDLSSPPHSPIMSTASLQQDPILAAVPLSPEQEPRPFLAGPTPAVASLVESTKSEEPALLMPEVLETSSPVSLEASAPQGDGIFKAEANLNEDDEDDDDDEEEEREGSQQVSVSDMSGTQPTEESRPGSAGPAGGSAWRGGGALLSELDSEDVSCSQQGASELSAPGVLEGTESMDDLGDASLKGAIVDMEGASAGSPDFEKVPDIPTNDFEEDEDEDEDDDDRVCDMEVGSERAEDPRRVRHDEEEEDEDVEMASEGVTESGLESYGNADEDDFAEDERLDNLNRVALLNPAPLLPSAAQWDQPNNPWAQSFQPAQNASAPLLAPTSPSVDAWQADSETPTQSPAQAWLELGSAPFVPQEPALHMPSASLPKLSPAQGPDEEHQPGLDPMQTLAPAPISGPFMSQSSTLSGADLAAHSSSETSTPEELRNYNKEGKLHDGQTPAPVLSLQPDPEDQDLGIHLDRGDGEEEEAETLPADEVLGGPATAPTSNPSSSSTSEDEASDTEGEAQLDEPLEDGGIVNAAFEAKPAAAQRCLSALEEGEEAIGEEWGSDTPHSANSAASYGFDTTTTASSSNAHSTGESCAKSPGIFSLEELPEEDKAPSLIGEPTSPRQPSSGEPLVDLPLGGEGGGSHPDEHHYMLCGRQGAELGEFGDLGGSLDPSLSLGSRHPEPGPDAQPPYYSAICEKTENSLAGNV
ncbi:nascent polypeptide-associated complex subunit alpha, muscle-specific form [Osmerus mordax]|uniref:nascent polypeptide-associated complex subunit alpha, muscle-specific form n=1 Tax=Osmerus mordax TaxID=8014 RepID=UPI00350FFE3B